MIEIIYLYFFVRKIGAVVESKGRRSFWYKVMAVVFWFGGEFISAIVSITFFGDIYDKRTIYLIAIVGAAVGSGIALLIVNNLSPVAKDPNFDDIRRINKF
ncbi:MAG: hypothetical protein GY943_26210 [Chloroflexi bacterium]|nr:hypothetical protein [Chloroflexota bacterium]